MTITTNNYEDWLYRYCEGLLDDGQRAAVEAWLAEHPEAAAEASLYDPGLRLNPTCEACPDKEALMRHEPQRTALWRRTAAACAAALLAAGAWLVWSEEGSESIAPATAERHTAPQPAPTTPAITPATPHEMSLQAAKKKPAKRIRHEALPPELSLEEPLEALAPIAAAEDPAPALLADAEPVAAEPDVILYIDTLLIGEEPWQPLTETATTSITAGERLRGFRQYCANLIGDYTHRAYSEARAFVVAWVSQQEENINQLKQS